MKTLSFRSFWTFWGFALLLTVLSLRLTPVYAAVSAYERIEGESFSENDSKGVSITWENDPSIVALGWIHNGDYACYKNVNFYQGVAGFEIRYSKKTSPSVDIKIVLDKVDGGTMVATTGFSTITGQNWTDYKTQTSKFKKSITGVHDVYLKFSSVDPNAVLAHIDYFRFLPDESEPDTRFLPPVSLKLKDSNGVTYQVLDGQKTAQVLEIPKDMELLDTRDTLSLTGTYDGGEVTVSLKVTKVAANAAKNCKKLKVVYFGTNITTVSKNAFKGCTKLNTLVFRGTAAKSKVKPSAFYDIKKKAVIYVPPANLSYLKKAFKADSKTKAKSFVFKKYQPVG